MRTGNTNWAGNHVYHASETIEPESVEELQERVSRTLKLKALGTRHCFNDIADTDAAHVSLASLNRILELDRDKMTVTIEGGVRYGHLCRFLHERGYALANLASLPHISVAGAIATATHGSGVNNGNLATSVEKLDLVAANGTLYHFSRYKNANTLPGVIVNLGALGVVAKITLSIEQSYQVRQDLYTDLPLSQIDRYLDAILSSAYSVSLFTDWTQDSFHQIWLKTRLDQNPHFAPPSKLYGATLASGKKHPLPNHDPVNCTEQLGQPGPWHERLPHFRLDYTPSSGEELQSEYYVPRQYASDAVEQLFTLRERIAPHVFVSEIRAIRSDSLWLSPCYQQDCVAIHFTWKPKWSEVAQLLPAIESKLEPFQAIPHWGKLSTMPAKQIAERYERFGDFRTIRGQLDPTDKFQNPFLKRLFA
ncbi:FAD-binding protein [Pelagicoccus sp. SDUM812003]|uniref:FAD-binding protein n=1 Tax=Pelagicoccus sp. SDUM812003 TaxID=3041267 RepID=UPI00280D0790|nr:FAD-binding protein [Pelagicoccus sp. SDUM812003]MDQ8205245.1 FAD-binding protein [Pelagicoccus sp. SDUM812003]